MECLSRMMTQCLIADNHATSIYQSAMGLRMSRVLDYFIRCGKWRLHVLAWCFQCIGVLLYFIGLTVRGPGQCAIREGHCSAFFPFPCATSNCSQAFPFCGQSTWFESSHTQPIINSTPAEENKKINSCTTKQTCESTCVNSVTLETCCGLM